MFSLPPPLQDLFDLLRPLGSGGRGEVFLVRRKKDGRDFALKTLIQPDAQTERLFRQEAALLSRLVHPNLLRIEDYFEGPPPSYTMEFLEGLPLKDALAGATETVIFRAFVGCCRGLHALHARGLLHRDLKSSNILVAADGEAKLLDFGLPGFGTPAYWPPEAKAGRYDAQSDLYGLGLSFLESLEGRGDLPEFFRNLLDRLVQDEPSERPSSALSLIKFLNRHVMPPFEIGSEEETRTIFSKVPWVSRPEEERFRSLEREAKILLIAGPMGVGRSRFVEEMDWRRKLAGLGCVTAMDAHRTPESGRKALEVAIRGARRDPKSLVLVEYDPGALDGKEGAETGAKEWIAGLRASEDARVLELKDLPKTAALELIRRATEHRPLPVEDEEKIALQSGGRPLLIIESLRQRLLAPGTEKKFSKSWEDACAARVASLGDGARRLLALLLTEETPTREEILSAWKGTVADADAAEAELRRNGLLGDAATPTPAHPSLAPAYRAALSEESLTLTHAAWSEGLRRSFPRPSASSEAPRIVAHALACGDAETARAWSHPAVAFLFGADRCDEVVALVGTLLPVTQGRTERAVLLGHLAPSLYRLGRYEESLKAYDDWYAAKGDDDTRVETVKYRLFTGQVLLAKGDIEKGRERLGEALATGDPQRHAALRPHHARAHAVLASSYEREGKTKEAEDHLRIARPLALGFPVLEADIENQRGLLEQAAGRYAEARALFESAAESARAARSPQSEAIAWSNLGLLDKERGDFSRAFEELSRALELARTGGEILQAARYRQNRALLLKDLALWEEAFSEMSAADDVLAVYGNADDRTLSETHKRRLEDLALDTTAGNLSNAEIARREGPRFRALARLQALSSRPGEGSGEDLAKTIEAIVALESPLLRAELLTRLAEVLNRSGLAGLGARVVSRVREEMALIQRNLPEEKRWMTTTQDSTA